MIYKWSTLSTIAAAVQCSSVLLLWLPRRRYILDDIRGQSRAGCGSAGRRAGCLWACRSWTEAPPPTPGRTAGQPRSPPGWPALLFGQVWLSNAPAAFLKVSERRYCYHDNSKHEVYAHLNEMFTCVAFTFFRSFFSQQLTKTLYYLDRCKIKHV